MIISHKHKFIFVKSKKTAGTSIEIALSKICGDKDILTQISPKDEKFRKSYSKISAQNFFVPFNKYKELDYYQLFFKGKRKKFNSHMPCIEIKKYISEDIWENYFKFSIERNPFDRAVSLYYWKEGNKKYKNIYDFLINNGLESFNNYDIYAINNVVAVNKVYMYEDLESFCEDISKRLGLKEKLEMPQYRAKSHKRKDREYKDLMDKKIVDLIKVIAAREIKLFNYKY